MAQGLEGLLGNPLFMMGTGLLGNQNNQWGGLLQGLAAAQGYKLSESRMKKDEEKEARQAELQAMQMKAMQDAQNRQKATQGLLTTMAIPEVRQAYATPEGQGLLRAHAAANADPAMLEKGGVLSPIPEQVKPTDSMMNYALAKQQGYGGTYLQFMKEKSGAQGPQPRMVEQGGVQYWAEGPNAGQPVLAGAAAPVGPTSEQFDLEKKLRGEVIDATKPFNVVQDAAGRILSTAKDPSAAGDLSLIFSYMKMLDPGSTVREGEFATAQNAAGVPVQIQNLWNKLKSGERLSPAQRADFLKQAGNLYAEAEKGYTGTRDYYTGLANQYQVSPDRVVTPGARYTVDQFKSVVDSAAAYLAAQGKK